MRYLTFDELTPEMEADRTLIHLASFGGVFPRRSIDIWRRRLKIFSDYVGVFAVERGRLLGQTFALRIPFTFSGGTEPVTGIAAVGTRPDRRRAGVARGILTEIHRREREAGVHFSTLWTNRSWGAHRLYEKLGYRDVYSSPWAVHAPVARRRPKPRGVGPGRRRDVADLERLHADQARGRLGFVERPAGFFSSDVATGYLDPPKDLLVARSGGQVAGYAHLEASPYRVICGELVARSAAVRRALVHEVQRRAKRRPFAFQQSPVTDFPELFRGSGFSTVPAGWYVFMANRLGHPWTERAAVSEMGTADPRFLCLSGDRF
jgi:GNAT superfamily N-acetyltransferase